MKNFLILILLACSVSLLSQNYNIVLRDTVMFPGQSLANIWGFKKGGKEYALVGASKGLIIVDVTDPANCFRVGNQLTDYINSLWREVKTFGNYAYITSEGTTPSGTPTPPGVGTGGLGIVDLSGLPTTPPTTVTKYYGDGEINNLLHRVHALHVDTIRSMLYLYGASGVSCTGALRLSISSPLSPVFQDKYCASYVHDGYVHKDTLFGAHVYEGKLSVIKFETNPFSGIDTLPYLIDDIITPYAFTHNSWLSTNRQYAFATDEKQNAYLTAYDVSDRTNIVEKDKIRTGTTNSIVHNTYINGNFALSSWYEDGVTITDVSRPSNLIQTGRYDTYATPPFPVSSNHFSGAWGVYPYLPSGNLLVTNMSENKVEANIDTGVLYILTPTYMPACYLEGNVQGYDLGGTPVNLIGATVAIQHTDPLNSTTTGLTGNYATGQPTAGTFNVIYSNTGYASQTVSVTLAAGTVTTKDVILSNLLPVELTSFTARATGKANLLEWTTASEKNTDRHEIEVKNLEDDPWKKIGEVDAAGDSPAELSYTFTDKFPERHSYYRLRTVDLDGQENLSPIVEVSRPGEPLSIGNIYPVPTTGILQLDVSSDRQLEAELFIGNLSGDILLLQTIRLAPGENRETLELPQSWADGQYWVRIAGGNLESRGTFLLLR